MVRRFSLIALLSLAFSIAASAQSADILAGYKFDSASPGPAVTLMAYAPDSFGDTYGRADFSMKTEPMSLSTAYLEVARTLCFWKNTIVEDLGLHAEFNGFMNMDNCNWLFGIDYTLPIEPLVKVSVLYKTFNGSARSNIPMQLSVLWSVDDIFGITGLEFRGLAKVWGETIRYWYSDANPKAAGTAQFAAKVSPQLWYSVGQFFGFDGLKIGGEVEMGYNYLGCSGFRARPFAALRISF